MSGMDFKVNTDNYLGFEFSQFQTDMYSLALSDPKSYFLMRKTVLESIKFWHSKHGRLLAHLIQNQLNLSWFIGET